MKFFIIFIFQRVAKIKLDDYNFYGGLIHVCYAPEHETIEDVREKISERKFIVDLKCKKYEKMGFGTLKYDLMVKKFAQKLRPSKKKAKKSVVLKPSEENPLINEPKLPEGWVKATLTGDESYDQSVNNIRLQLKTTIVSLK